MLKSLYETVHLKGVLEWRRDQDRKYLMSLTTENLLLPYHLEATLRGITFLPKDLHGGWDSPLSEIRGTVCSHWLSSAAQIYAETGDIELKCKADFIVSEIARCQEVNGGEWCFSIPEKYLLLLKKGKTTWAPHYVCHKTMMAMVDMYKFAGNTQALDIVKKAANWFYRYTEDITPEQMVEMMWVETGGIMELFADLYAITGDEKHLTLMRRYERKELYDLLETDENPLVNMHANATVPEIHGAARAYEVTGEERYRKLVERYWTICVDQCGLFATGGQTSGEVWTPDGRHSSRLSDSNQEHCVVYNMMRLSDYLFRWTGDSKYADFWERNLYNGIFAQGFWKEKKFDATGAEDMMNPKYGYVAYYLPLHANAQKVWGSATQHFWCCHHTLLQANASFPQSLYYFDEAQKSIIINQFLDSSVSFTIGEAKVELIQSTDHRTGEIIRIEKVNRQVLERPNNIQMNINIKSEKPVRFTLAIRKPWWIAGEMKVTVDGQKLELIADKKGYLTVDHEWSDNTIVVTMPKTITTWPLPDQPDTIAFLDGPVTLVGVEIGEKTLYYKEKPEEIFRPYDERRWSTWQKGWKTVGQPENFVFIPINEIGYEKYTTYFPIKKIDD